MIVCGGRAKLDMPVRPDAVNAKIPKQYDADGKQFRGIDPKGGVDAEAREKRFEQKIVGHDKNEFVDAQAREIDQGKLREMFVQLVLLARFGKRPQRVPDKIANDGANDRQNVGKIIGDMQ